MEALLITLMTLFGAALYRWRGHASKYKKFFPRPFNQIAFALPYALACLAADASWYVALIVLAIGTLGVLTGHGKFMDLGTWQPLVDDERLEFLIKPLENRIPQYWYDFIGLGITGMAVTVASGVVLLNPLIAISGFLKAPAYAIARLLGLGTNGGEWLTGAFLWGSLAGLVVLYGLV